MVNENRDAAAVHLVIMRLEKLIAKSSCKSAWILISLLHLILYRFIWSDNYMI